MTCCPSRVLPGSIVARSTVGSGLPAVSQRHQVSVLTGRGGSISGAGDPVIAEGMLFVNSGYWLVVSSELRLGTGIRGGALIAFGEC